MNAHDEIRGLLPLAAAGALETAEAEEIARHTAQCPACAAELREWAALAAGLGVLPRGAAPPGLAAAATRAVEQALRARARRRETALAAALSLFCWTAGMVAWAAARLFLGRWMPEVGLLWWAVLTAVPVWLTAGVAAVALGRRPFAWRVYEPYA
jgi:anti-sigma factor RsiW